MSELAYPVSFQINMKALLNFWKSELPVGSQNRWYQCKAKPEAAAANGAASAGCSANCARTLTQLDSFAIRYGSTSLTILAWLYFQCFRLAGKPLLHGKYSSRPGSLSRLSYVLANWHATVSSSFCRKMFGESVAFRFQCKLGLGSWWFWAGKAWKIFPAGKLSTFQVWKFAAEILNAVAV